MEGMNEFRHNQLTFRYRYRCVSRGTIFLIVDAEENKDLGEIVLELQPKGKVNKFGYGCVSNDGQRVAFPASNSVELYPEVYFIY